jgi:hypothetical protein
MVKGVTRIYCHSSLNDFKVKRTLPVHACPCTHSSARSLVLHNLAASLWTHFERIMMLLTMRHLPRARITCMDGKRLRPL